MQRSDHLRRTLLHRHSPVTLMTLALAATVFLTLSCNQPPTAAPAPINTVLTASNPPTPPPPPPPPPPINPAPPASNPPTPQIANPLGFRSPPAKDGRLAADVRLENAGCTSCHQSDSHTMHLTSVQVSCVDCHGGKH